MGKPTICICENKDADQLDGNTAELISAFVFATRIVHFLFFLNPKFQAPSLLLCLYSLICVRPVRKPHCWFSHEAAQMPGDKPILLHKALKILKNLCHCVLTFEPPRGKTNNVVSEQVRHKPASTSTEKS